jgi:hypothetical protein
MTWAYRNFFNGTTSLQAYEANCLLQLLAWKSVLYDDPTAMLSEQSIYRTVVIFMPHTATAVARHQSNCPEHWGSVIVSSYSQMS